VTQYGVLSNVVATAGSIMAAGGAISLAWRGRIDRWEPSEQDVPNGAQKVGALVAAVLIGLVWAIERTPSHVNTLNTVVVGSLIATVVSLLLYGFLVGNQTYIRWEGTPNAYRLIGGFWTTSAARKIHRAGNQPISEVFKGMAYEPDRVWPRPSRQLAKTCFVLLYMSLTVSGTLALAAVAIRLGVTVAS
jgi:hypothetical protein